MKGLWGTLIDSYKKPAGTLANMAAAPKTGVVLGICGIQTVFFALIFLFFGMKINGLTGGFYKVVNTPLTFFMALIAGAGILAVWGALVMLLARGMAKKQMSYMQGLGVAAAKAAAQLPFTVVTVFFALVMPLANQWTYIIILLVYSAGNLLAYFFIPAAMDAFCADDRNKRIWQLFVTFVVNFAATYLIAYIFAKIIGTDIVNMLQMF